ncbi:oligosaccharide flippase family protein [Providencia alcalifaciens]|uniref:oligosaccharide flippase family protein n=1 Tax=Providencia alcalifaciens TaxID=126385 RepID=UPI000D956985|nr:oligosaccharide flippase family protein [Providencia alcalifaciens]MTC26107.1 oligosaccharide flippase family protein [Providencia alcalifaciens]SPY70816.1 Polysaccharide biosynthesis protein [Providencia alcalifaciens]
MHKFLTYLSSLWITTAFSAFLAFLFQTGLARLLTPKTLGEFNSTLAYLLVFGAIAGFGADNSLLKIFGKGSKYGNKYGLSIICYAILTTLISFILLILVTFSFFPNINLNNLVILSPTLLALTSFNIQSAVLQIEEKYHQLGVLQIFNNGMRLCCLSFLYFGIVNNNDIYYLYSLSSILIFLISIKSFLKLYKGNVLKNDICYSRINIERIKAISKTSIPFGLASVAHTIYFQCVIFLLSYLSSPEMAGFYSVAFNIIIATYLFPAIIYQRILLPKIHRWSNIDPKKMLTVYQTGNGIMLAIGLLISVPIIYFSDQIINSLFGEQYKQAATYLSLLAICIPIRFLISGLGAILSTGNLIKYKLYCMLIIAIINAVLNIIFIPIFSIYSAIFIAILSEILLATLFLMVIYFKLYGKDTFNNWFCFLKGFKNVSEN